MLLRWAPVLLGSMSSPVNRRGTGSGGGRGSPFAWLLLGHARAPSRLYTQGLEVPSSMSSALSSVLRPSPGAHPRGGRVYSVTLRIVKPGRPWSPGGRVLRVLRVLRGDHFPIILLYDPQDSYHATTRAETEKQGEQKDTGIHNAKRSECLSRYYVSSQS
jgi:hypothetical protein